MVLPIRRNLRPPVLLTSRALLSQLISNLFESSNRPVKCKCSPSLPLPTFAAIYHVLACPALVAPNRNTRLAVELSPAESRITVTVAVAVAHTSPSIPVYAISKIEPVPSLATVSRRVLPLSIAHPHAPPFPIMEHTALWFSSCRLELPPGFAERDIEWVCCMHADPARRS